MNISHSDLYRIVLEEYAKEENIELTEDKADDLLAWIKGGKKPADLEYDKTVPDPPTLPDGPNSPSETYPMEIPHSKNLSDDDIVASISQLIQGKDPEVVADLFQLVFSQIPGVELGDAEEDPESLYSPGAEGRPVAGFQLEEIVALIREVLNEGHYHDMGDEDEMYDALDPEGFERKTDAELVNMAWTDGIEKMIILDGEGGLANREEVTAALKDV